jgi:HlyD family secretion protein
MRVTVGGTATITVLLAMAAGLIWAVLPRPILVEAATVTRASFVATVDEDGKTRIRERYVVAAPLAGHLMRVRLKAGDPVSSDETVATILPSPAPLLDPRSRREAEERLGTAEAALERANTAVERTRAQVDQAQKDLARTRALVERGASTAQALERAELALLVADRDLRAAEFQYHAAEHELAQARALLARHQEGPVTAPESWRVTAPLPGVVLKVMQESETAVQPGTPILEIGDPRDLEIVVDVLSTDAVEIRPNASVAIVNWGGQGALRGRVRRIEPAAFTKISTLGVEEQRVNVLIDLISSPEERVGLGDGFQLDTRITVYSKDDATIVPVGSLFRRGDRWNLFVVENGRAQIREVTLLRRSGRSAAVAAGVTTGEYVIVYPNDRIAPGVRVEFR